MLRGDDQSQNLERHSLRRPQALFQPGHEVNTPLFCAACRSGFSRSAESAPQETSLLKRLRVAWRPFHDLAVFFRESSLVCPRLSLQHVPSSVGRDSFTVPVATTMSSIHIIWVTEEETM